MIFDISIRRYLVCALQYRCSRWNAYIFCLKSQLPEGRDPVTIHEASARYNIPMEILKEYESWGLCGAVKRVMGVW